MKRKSIFFVLPDGFLVRSYLCTPVFQRLLQLKQDLDLVFITPMNTVRPYLEEHGCFWEPLFPAGSTLRERASFFVRTTFTHRMAAYRFNRIHQFAKLRRKQKISAQMRRQYRDLIRRKDAAHARFGFPFPRSRRILDWLVRLNYSGLMAANSLIDSYFDRYDPVLMFTGTTQSPFVTSYVHHAQRRHIPCIAGLGSWDQPTMDGPLARGVNEYWVWNNIMRDELICYHGIASEDIAVTGAPQFDSYARMDIALAQKKARQLLEIPEGYRVLTLAAYTHRLGYGEPSIASHVASKIEAGKYASEPVAFVIRSHPSDYQFQERFGHLKEYPFVRLCQTPMVRSIEPQQYKEDTELLGGLLSLSDALLCGPGTVAIDAACFDTPVVNLRFDGDAQLPGPISARSHFDGDHYQKLVATRGTRVVDSFEEMDAAIRLYLTEPSIDADGREAIRREFAGWTGERGSSDRIAEQIYNLLGLDAPQSAPRLAKQR